MGPVRHRIQRSFRRAPFVHARSVRAAEHAVAGCLYEGIQPARRKVRPVLGKFQQQSRIFPREWQRSYLFAQQHCDHSYHAAVGRCRLSHTIVRPDVPNGTGFAEAHPLREQHSAARFTVGPCDSQWKASGRDSSAHRTQAPPGSHNIEFSNPGFDTVRKTLKVEPDQPITITHDFDAR